MRKKNVAIAICLLSLGMAPAVAQVGGREPLNNKEIDDLRETAQEPEKRLKLMVQFAHARLTTIEQLRSEPRLAADRGPRVHDLLEDFTKLVDEIGDNIDDYASRKEDLRKALKAVIEGDTDFQLKLRTLKEQGPGAGGKASEVQDYTFALQNAIEAVNLGLDDTRKLLADQEAAFKDAKKKK
jgi:chromosome segregation ATPase